MDDNESSHQLRGDQNEQLVRAEANLRSTKTELFNKLISNQSQQMIVTTPSRKSGTENLNRANSFNGARKSPQQVKCENQVQQQQRASSNIQSNDPQNLLPEDFKRHPFVFSRSRSRWYTNEEVASILTNFSSHPEWQTNELQIRPKSGAVLLYSREKVRYRQDGYCWKKRKNGRTTREDHMKLKVQGIECIYGCYVHSAILPTFHRRCYWLLQNPDIVLVHYLNQPPDDQNKMMITFNSSLLEADTRRSWTNEEIIEEIGSVFGGISQIQHTLNINFPPSSAFIHHASNNSNNNNKQHKQQNQTESRDSERMIDSSPQSQVSLSTNNSEILNGHIGMTFADRQLQQQQYVDSDQRHQQQQQQQHSTDSQESDELMAVAQDNILVNNSDTQTSCDNDLSSMGCESQLANGQEEMRLQEDATMSMTFNIVNESDIKDASLISSRPDVDCCAYSNPSSVNLDENNNLNSIGSPMDEQTVTNRLTEQSLCSPVTQIFNKIVDDIETYSLPLEPNQFNHSNHHHHHHHGLSISSMNMGEVESQDDERGEHDELHHHHDIQSHNRLIGQQFHSRSIDDINRSSCTMDLSTCDLFGNETIQDDGSMRAHNETGEPVDEDEENLMLAQFNLASNQVVDHHGELESSVVNSMANVDDLRDLIIDLQPNVSSVDQNSMLVDNTLQLFNYKSDSNDDGGQLDMKSCISDTDTINRLSPLVQVPRCNSTGNAMHPSILHQGSQHLSANFLTSNQVNLANNMGQYEEFRSRNSRASSTTNQTSSSTSCSPSPSSASWRPSGGGGSNNNNSNNNMSTRSVGLDSFQLHSNSTSPSSVSYMRLPLQQRQKSEQQESSNSVLSGLLPKALSLDGSELSVTANHCSTGQVNLGYRGSMNEKRQHSVSLNQKHPPQSALNFMAQRLEGPLQQQQQQQGGFTSSSVTIPKDSANESLVSTLSDYQESESLYLLQSASLSCSNMNNNANDSIQKQSSNISSPATSSSSGLLPILDYVPNWCEVSGGTKVLIVGHWSSLLDSGSSKQQQQLLGDIDGSPFFAVFDKFVVPATLIQDNVLRCYAPRHEQGFITLKVLYSNIIVSEQVLFEMRPMCNQLLLSQQQQQQSDSSLIEGNCNGNGHRNSSSSNQSSSSALSCQTSGQTPQVSPSSLCNNSNNINLLGDTCKALTRQAHT